MKLLLTSGGVTVPSIERALIELLGKPIAKSTALCIPTAQWGHPMCGPVSARGFVAGIPPWGGMATLGWRELGMLELTALPSIDPKRWSPWVRDADALLVDGGDAAYLAHWIRASGLAELLPTLTETVWVGVSAGSMALTPRIGSMFVSWDSPDADQTLGLVDFCLFPHLDVFPTNTLEAAERWAEELAHPAYAMDDRTAIQVVDGVARVISEGRWVRLGSEVSRPAASR